MPIWSIQPVITERDSQEEHQRQRKARQLRQVREFRRRIIKSTKERTRRTYPKETKAKAKNVSKKEVTQLSLFTEGRQERPSLLTLHFFFSGTGLVNKLSIFFSKS